MKHSKGELGQGFQQCGFFGRRAVGPCSGREWDSQTPGIWRTLRAPPLSLICPEALPRRSQVPCPSASSSGCPLLWSLTTLQLFWTQVNIGGFINPEVRDRTQWFPKCVSQNSSSVGKEGDDLINLEILVYFRTAQTLKWAQMHHIISLRASSDPPPIEQSWCGLNCVLSWSSCSLSPYSLIWKWGHWRCCELRLGHSGVGVNTN